MEHVSIKIIVGFYEESRALFKSAVMIWRFFMRHQILILSVLLISAAAGAEIYLHARPLSNYVLDFIYRQGADLPVHRPSANLDMLVELRPGVSAVFEEEGMPRRKVSINALGLRDAPRSVEKAPGVFRIIMFGSSYTYGALVNDGETMAAYMERQLNEGSAGPRYEVFNAGVSSYGPAQMTALARQLIGKGVDPDLLLFHVSLLGPRGFLDRHIDLGSYGKDPSLFREHFVLPFAENFKGWGYLCSKSRLALLLVAHYNRMVSKDERYKRLEKNTVQRHIDAINKFADDFKEIPMSAVECPCLDDHDMLIRKAMEKTPLDLDCLFPPKGAGEEYIMLHPPAAYVYAEYAAQWIRILEEKGLLPD